MTPTLLGRWQTRLLLFLVIGLPITALYAFYLNDWVWAPINVPLKVPFLFITAIVVLGLIVDIPYIQIQRFRWDNDWPFAFQFFFSILEFLAIFGLMRAGLLEPVLSANDIPEFSTAAIHFALVFVPSFLAVLGGIQIFYIRWRFKGGELGRHRS